MPEIEKLIILDFDGTVLNSNGAWFKVYQIYCVENHLTISEQIIQNQNMLSHTDWIETIQSTHKITHSLNSLITALNEIAKEVYNEILPKMGFAAFVQVQCTSKSKIIIVSREEPDLIQSYLDHYRISEISEVLQDCNQNRSLRNFYTDVTKLYRCQMKNIIVTDDSLSHCTAAKQAGAFVVGMNDNHSVERQNQMGLICDLYIDDFTTLIKL